MIQKAADMELEVREEMRGGKGTISITHVLKQAQMKGKCRLCGRIVINPGCSIGEHVHEQEEEIYYILKGKGIIVDDGNRQEVNEGDVILTGNGAAHSIENNGEEPLEIMAVILLY